MKYAISSCLAGINCKYSGGNNENKELLEFLKDHEYICICPEVSGGLPIPRASCEIVKDRVINTLGEDVSEQFHLGAKIALEHVLAFGADMVITQPRSPSCGKGMVYDGTFQGKLIAGDGIFVKQCMRHGIRVMNADDFIQYLHEDKICKG